MRDWIWFDGYEWFGGDRYKQALRLKVAIGSDVSVSWEELRKQVRKILGISNGGYSMEKAMEELGIVERYLGPVQDPDNLLTVQIVEGEDEDGVKYLATYEIWKGRIKLASILVLAPSWWVK